MCHWYVPLICHWYAIDSKERCIIWTANHSRPLNHHNRSTNMILSLVYRSKVLIKRNIKIKLWRIFSQKLPCGMIVTRTCPQLSQAFAVPSPHQKSHYQACHSRNCWFSTAVVKRASLIQVCRRECQLVLPSCWEIPEGFQTRQRTALSRVSSPLVYCFLVVQRERASNWFLMPQKINCPAPHKCTEISEGEPRECIALSVASRRWN